MLSPSASASEIGAIPSEVNTPPLPEGIGNTPIGRSLSVNESQSLISQMEQNAQAAPEIELTPQNWINLFGEDGTVETPIGSVKMGENQYFKLAQQGRNGKLGMVKPTLTTPSVIIEDNSKDNNTNIERVSSYVFVKVFTKQDGSRYYYFTSVTVSKDGKEVVISNQEKSNKRISKLLQHGKIAWIDTAFSLHPTTQIEESVPLNDSNKPTSTDNQSALLGINSPELSSDKGNQSSSQSQEIEQLSSDAQFDTHIGTLPTDQAINAITTRRGAQEADQYATWRRAILSKELNKAQKTLNAKPKPFDPSRYTDYALMKSEERKYNDAIQATRTQTQQTIQQLSNEIATIDGYLAERNRQIAAEREAQREAENPLRNGITQAVERQPINTLDQYIARHIALGGRLRMTDQYTNGLASELGITPGSAEHRELLSILSNNDGMTPEQLAHHISENIEPEYRHLIAGRDTQDIRNTIIDTIAGGVTSRRRAYQYIADINNQASAAEQRYYEQQEIQARIDADTEAAIRRYEEQLLSSLTQEDLAIIDAMAGDYWDEIIAIQQYEQEAYNDYDTTTTTTTPAINQQGRETTTIQPSTTTSQGTTITQDSHHATTSRPATPQPSGDSTTTHNVQQEREQQHANVDNQGNPIDANGNLIIETVTSIDEITDNDFETPTRTVQLPTLPDNVSNAIGTNGRPVIIKKNVFEKNGNTHVELEPSDSREILQSALYNTNVVASTQPIKRPYYKVAIRTGEKNAVVVLDVYQGKEYVEIVGWRKVNEKGLEKMQRQAEREGGQFLILSPIDGAAAALSALPSGTSSTHKDSERRENNKISSPNFSSEPNPILSKDTTSSPNSNNSSDQDNTPYSITPAQYTTKRGKVLDMHLVKFTGELRNTVTKLANSYAKQMKGWWDKSQGGFMMRNEEDAKRLAEYVVDVQAQEPVTLEKVSMDDVKAVNDGNVLFTEPQQPKAESKEDEYRPVWQYSIHVDAYGYTTLRRDDISGEIPISDNWAYSANSPEEMLEILRNPYNGMQEILEAVGITLENKIKTLALDRKIAEQRKQEYENLRTNGVNGYKIGEKVIYKGKEATIYDFEEFGAHNPVLDTGLSPVLYEVVNWTDIKKPQQNQSASSQNIGQDLTTGYSIDNDAETATKVQISNHGAKHELNKIIHKYAGQRKTKGFISDLAVALGDRDNTPRQTYYFDFKDKDGNPYTLRISNHNVNANNANEDEKEISIVIKSRRQPNKFIPGTAEVKEYVYFKESIAKGDGHTLSWIAQDIATMLDTGVYADNSGIAVINTSPIQPTNQGQFNLVSDDRMAELKARLRKKLGGQMNIGLDPEILSIGLEIAVGHIDRGIKSFTDFARVMIADLGDTIRPYLKAFYNGARELPEVINTGLSTGMTPYNEVQQFDVANFDQKNTDPIATATTIAREAQVATEVATAKQRIKQAANNKKSLPSQQNQLNLFDNTDNNNEDGRNQNTRANNRRTQPRREKLPQTQSVGARTPIPNTLASGTSQRGNTPTSSNQSRNRPLYDVNKNYTNEEIGEIVSSVTDIVDGKVVITEPITDDIRTICHQYRSGGVTKEGRGILDEYYTDGKIVDAVAMLITPYFTGNNPIRVLEPSVGVGNFLSAVDNIPLSQVQTFEINPTTARIAKILYPAADVNLRSFETEFIDETGNKKPLPPKFNLVIGNPPYGSHRGLYKGLGEESKIARYEDYFVKRSLDVLNEGGILAMVLPSSWIDRHTTYGGYTIEAAYRLPSGAFEATQVGTDIVILRKDSSIPTTQHAPYFTQHPERILGEAKLRKGRYGKMEYYVEGNIDTALDAIKRDHATRIADNLNIEPTADNLNNIEDAINETGNTQKAQTIVQNEHNTSPSASRSEDRGSGRQTEGGRNTEVNNPTHKHKRHLNRGVETVPTSQQFTHTFSPGEVEAFADTLYDGTLINPTRHSRYANYIGGKAMHDFYYAEGDIYAKLYQLEREKETIIDTYGQEQYEKQKHLLESVLPKRKGLSEITISPNTAFVKNLQITLNGENTTLKDAFIAFCSKLPYNAFGDSSSWEVHEYMDNEQVYGQDKERNALVRERRKRVANDLFVKFLGEELTPSAQQQVVEAFNREYNSVYRPDYSQVPMFSTINRDFRGKPLKLTTVQLAGIGRMTVKGVGVLAHEVGFGKTLSGILAMHEAMTRGFASKPLIVVPNDNILQQWVDTIKEVLPSATVNTLGNLGTSYDLTDFKVNDGEFTIVTYEGLKAMSFTDDTYNRLADRFSYITEDLNKHQSERDIQKKQEKRKELKGKLKRGAKPTYNFEDFGFDWLTVDEVHNANHIVSKVRLDKSVASDFRSQSQRSSDLGLKTWLAAQYIQEENNGRNVLLLSATPFTNKPLEYYSILSLVANDMLRRRGFFNVDQFFATFMEADNELEIGANGRPTQKTNVRRFRNNGLFQQLLSEFIDIKGEEDNPDLIRPDRHNREYKITPNELTEDAMAAIQDLLNDNDTVLQGIGHARAAAFSPYATSLLGIQPKNHKEFVKNSPKINATIKLIEQNHKDRPDAGQIIYSEVGVEFFPLIRDYLVKESGFKPSEVRIITGATSNAERINIQAAFNRGEVKVVIGSPAIKEGLNLQENTTDMYILSLPWNFTQLRQIEGRGWRQGNKWENIRINYMLTNNSVDVFMLQRLQLKQGLYNEAMKSGAESLDVSDIDTSELKTVLITDPAVRAEIVTTQEKARLEQQKTQVEADLSFVLRKFETYEKLLKKLADKKKEIDIFRGYAAKGGTGADYWKKHIRNSETQLQNIEREIEQEKENLLRKGVNVKDIERQTTQAQTTIQDIQQKIDNLEKHQEELTEKYRREQQQKEQEQGDLLATYIKERKAENNSGFYKIRPKDYKKTQQIKQRFSFRELNDETFSSPASTSAIGEVPQGEGVKELSSTPEEQDIIDRAKADGTYLLAPNGQPTNLTPRGWVQVRTRAFKRWFGDWEKAARIEKLRNSTPINIVFDNQYDLNRDSAKQWMKDNIRGEYTNKDTGETIQISRVGINEVTSHGTRDDAHLISLMAIPQLIEDSIFIEEIANTKEHDKYDSYRYYVCGAKINGEDYTIKIVIGVKGDSKYYDHRLTQIEKGILIDNLNGLSNSVAENQNASNSMGKDSKLLSILQTNSSKIVDSNGEPLVVFHGSNAQFTIFDNSYNQKSNKGFFFTDSNTMAQTYGNTQAYFLNIPNAYTIQGNNAPWNMVHTNLTTLFPNVKDKIALHRIKMQKALEDGIIKQAKYDYWQRNYYAKIDFINDRSKNSIIDIIKKFIYAIQIRNFNSQYTASSTREIEKAIQSLDDNANIIFRDIKDYGPYTNPASSKQAHDVFVVTNPNQIKSATDNIGTFDNSNPDIRFRSIDAIDPYTVEQDIKKIVGITSTVNKSHYIHGNTDNGETWQLRISNHPARYINIEDNLQEGEQMPHYFTSIVITDNPDAVTRNKETIAQQQQYNNNDQTEVDQVIIDTRTLDSDNYQEFLDEFRQHFDLFTHTGRSYFSEDFGTRFRTTEKVKNTNDPIHTAQQVVADNMPQRIEQRTRQLADKLQVPITVIHNNDQLRPLGHDYNELADWLDGKIDGRTHRTVGMFDSHTNRLFVFAHTLQTTKDPIAELERTITHEVVAHYGLRQLLGEENLATFLSDVWSTMPPMRQQRWGKYALNKPREHSLTPQELATIYSNPAIQRKAAEEYIAHLSEEGVKNPTLWQHICAAFRRILRRIGIYSYAPTNADIRYTLALSYRNLTSTSSTHVGTVASKREQRERVQSLPSESNLGDSHIAPLVRETSEGVNNSNTSLRFIGDSANHQTATNTLDAIDETTRQYQASLDDIRQDIIHATTPQPGDTPLTIAEKIRFRSVVDGEFLNRDNTSLQDLMSLSNKIITAMSENDKKHRFTGFTEAHYDSMQRLSNLLQDIKENGGIFDEDYDPWITQNQAASRAQSSMNVFNITYRQPLFAAIRQCILAAFPGINTTDKAKVDDAYYRLSLYVQARTAVERQHVKSKQAKAEATEKGEEYQERDFAGLAGVQYAIFGIHKAIDDTVEQNQHNHEKLSAYAQEIGIPTVEEYIQDIEAKIGVPAISSSAASQIGEVHEVGRGFISPEDLAIIDRAKADGTYLLAPNGSPTNLTPRQWI